VLVSDASVPQPHIPAHQHPRGAWRRPWHHGVLLTGLGTELDDGGDIEQRGFCLHEDGTCWAPGAGMIDAPSYEENDVRRHRGADLLHAPASSRMQSKPGYPPTPVPGWWCVEVKQSQIPKLTDRLNHSGRSISHESEFLMLDVEGH
jgi:hypothetical protein